LDGTDEYTGSKKLGTRRVELTLYTDKRGKLDSAILRARKIVDGFPEIQKKIERYIAQKIYPTYNEVWRPDEKPYTLQQIVRKLKLEEVIIGPTASPTFWFDAGDIFQEHDFQLMMGPREAFNEHDMPG
jgi:hypothetical protein